MNVMRSLALEEIVDALSHGKHNAKLNLISLQAVHGNNEIDELANPNRIYRPLEAQDAKSGPRSIDEMAALISTLDLVITCDSICAHLAPALGIETWLLLSAVPDWRWGISGKHTQWYDKLRLFRQQRQGDWRPVCQQVEAALIRKIEHGASPHIAAPPTNTLPPISKVLESSSEQKQCRHGLFRFLSGDQYIGESLRHYGEFSEQEVILFTQILSPGDTVVEVGSNIGTHTIPLATIVGDTGSVLAFEPQRYIFELLRHNAQANDLTQIIPHRQALGAKAGKIIVPLLDPAMANNFGGVPLGRHQQGDEVEVSTVDALGITQCNLLKADVEGMEADVIRGAIQTIKACAPILYLENDRESKSAELIDLIKSLGYRIYMHNPLLYNTNNYFNNSQNLFGNICSMNILCVPRARKLEINGLNEIT